MLQFRASQPLESHDEDNPYVEFQEGSSEQSLNATETNSIDDEKPASIMWNFITSRLYPNPETVKTRHSSFQDLTGVHMPQGRLICIASTATDKMKVHALT